MSESGYQFTNTWFESTKGIWDELISKINPTRILEIGSYEGASACWIIEKLAAQKNIELHCVDTWHGGIEHQENGAFEADMSAVEQRFKQNTQKAIGKVSHNVDLTAHKGASDITLANMLANDKRCYFDFIYVDGSHQAPDVLCDALLSFRLLRTDGVIAFDDYLWQEVFPNGTDPIRCPKPAIDAFTNIYCRKLRVISAPLQQLYVQKIAD